MTVLFTEALEFSPMFMVVEFMKLNLIIDCSIACRMMSSS